MRTIGCIIALPTTQEANTMQPVFPIDQKLYARAATVAREAVGTLEAYSTDLLERVTFESDPEKVPSTGKTIAAAFDAALKGGAKMPILATPSDCKCFLGEKANNVYRALHDFDHYQAYITGSGGTTKLSDEIALNVHMVDRIMAMVTAHQDIADTVRAILFADLVGQAVYYAKHRDFISNHGQADFAKWLGGFVLAGILQGDDPLQTLDTVKAWPKF